MAERVRITDVAPRDGLQNEPGVVGARDKARLIDLLCATGVNEVEATSFVSPKWVPQLGDAEEVLRLVRESAPSAPTSSSGTGVPPVDTSFSTSTVSLSSMPCPILTALVPNEKGFDRAAALHDPAGGFPLKIAVFTAASETFSKKNTNATIAQSFERFGAFLPRAFALGMRVRMYVSCAVSCPFEGPIAPEQVRRVVDGLRALVPRGERAEIDLGDTIGAAEPSHIDALLGVFDAAERAALTLHLHDTFGRAAACVRRALELGVRSFDGSVAGLGGCPYAGTREKPAPGNISTESLVRTVHDAGFTTRVDVDALADAAAFARRVVAEARSRHEACAPTGPRREGSGA